jgi:hypothetical protein
MRKGYLFLAGAGAVLLAACSGDKKASINDDLKKDLELASSSDGITLANSSANGSQQVVSAIEQTALPKARKQAASTRVRTHKAAPKAPPQVVRAQAPATVEQTEPQTVAQGPAAEDQTPVSPRPQPASVSYPSGSSSGDDGRATGRGSSGAGAVLGTILGAVIRGGVVMGDDDCDPRTDGRNRSVNHQIPFPIGRIGGVSRSGVTVPSRRIPRF